MVFLLALTVVAVLAKVVIIAGVLYTLRIIHRHVVYFGRDPLLDVNGEQRVLPLGAAGARTWRNRL